MLVWSSDYSGLWDITIKKKTFEILAKIYGNFHNLRYNKCNFILADFWSFHCWWVEVFSRHYVLVLPVLSCSLEIPGVYLSALTTEPYLYYLAVRATHTQRFLALYLASHRPDNVAFSLTLVLGNDLDICFMNASWIFFYRSHTKTVFSDISLWPLTLFENNNVLTVLSLNNSPNNSGFSLPSCWYPA